MAWLNNLIPVNSLTQAEMTLCLAMLYQAGGPDIQLYEADESDVKQAHDFLILLPKLSTKGVRAVIEPNKYLWWRWGL